MRYPIETYFDEFQRGEVEQVSLSLPRSLVRHLQQVEGIERLSLDEKSLALLTFGMAAWDKHGPEARARVEAELYQRK